jgi:hypothetical protein
MRTGALLGSLLLWLVLNPASTQGATLRVPAEYSTIQAGIDAASNGDVVLVAPGSYPDFETRDTASGGLMTSCAFMKDGVIVRSEGGPEVTSLDFSQMSGPQPFSVLALELPSTATAFEGFAMEGPYAPSVFAFFCGNMTFKNCDLRYFDGGPTAGGAVIVNGNASFIDCEFTNCVAAYAGAIYQNDGHLELVGCTFRECSEMAVWVDQSSTLSSAYVESCTFIDNWN